MKNRLDNITVQKLKKSLAKTDVIRLERLRPEELTKKQLNVLKNINIERSIYNTAFRNIDIPVICLTSLLNLGRTSRSAIRRVREKTEGVRPYSIMDLVVIQFIELMVMEGIDVTSISHDKRLKTALNGQGSKTRIIQAYKQGTEHTLDSESVSQFNLQVEYFSTRLKMLDMATWDLVYLLYLGVLSKSNYNKVREKILGRRAYSILDLVMARLIEVAIINGINVCDIAYDPSGRRVSCTS